MQPDKLTQGFWISSRQNLAAWNRQKKLLTLSFTSAVMIVAISSMGKASATAALLTDGRFAPADLQYGWERSPEQVQFLRSRVAQRQRQSPEQVQFLGSLSTADNSRPRRFLLVQTPTTSVPLVPTTLPPANLPIQQNDVVTVPPVNRKEASIPSSATVTISPTTLPPPAFSTNQTPSVSVPPLPPIPTQTPTPDKTSNPVTPPAEKVTPTLSSSPAIEFGQPLPKTTD